MTLRAIVFAVTSALAQEPRGPHDHMPVKQMQMIRFGDVQTGR